MSDNNHNLPEYNADDFEALEGLETIQRNVAMYLGSSDGKAILHCLVEAIDNVVDESSVLIGYRRVKCNIEFFPDGSVVVADNGRGIPVEFNTKRNKRAIYIAFEHVHGGSKLKGNTNSSYNASIGTHGIGMSAVNAVSDYLDIVVKREGKVYSLRYEKGIRTKELEEIGTCDVNDTGTTVRFKYNPDLLKPFDSYKGTLDYPYQIEEVIKMLENYVTFNDNIEFSVKWDTGLTDEEGTPLMDSDGEAQFLKSEYNPFTLVERVSGEYKVQTIEHNDKDNDYSVTAYTSLTEGFNGNVRVSAVNGLRMVHGGTHQDAFEDEIFNYVETALKQRGVIDDTVKLDKYDVMYKVNYIVLLKTNKKDFGSQSKSFYASATIGSLLRVVFKNAFVSIPVEDMKVLIDAVEFEYVNKVASKKQLKEKKRGRISKEKNRELAIKLQDCDNPESRRKENEIWYVEGNSAGNAFAKNRDTSRVAIAAFKGKPLNVNKHDFETKIKNDDQFLLIQKVVEMNKFSKHNICTDGDIDGRHIRSLICLIFMEYFPEVIDKGQLFIAHAPLHRVSKGSKTVYTYTEQQLDEFVADGYSVERRYKGLGEMEEGELYRVLKEEGQYTRVTMDNFDEIVWGETTKEQAVKLLTSKDTEMRKVVSNYCITPRLQEYLDGKTKQKKEMSSKVNPLLVDSEGIPLTQEEVDEIFGDEQVDEFEEALI